MDKGSICWSHFTETKTVVWSSRLKCVLRSLFSTRSRTLDLCFIGHGCVMCWQLEGSNWSHPSPDYTTKVLYIGYFHLNLWAILLSIKNHNILFSYWFLRLVVYFYSTDASYSQNLGARCLYYKEVYLSDHSYLIPFHTFYLFSLISLLEFNLAVSRVTGIAIKEFSTARLLSSVTSFCIE